MQPIFAFKILLIITYFINNGIKFSLKFGIICREMLLNGRSDKKLPLLKCLILLKLEANDRYGRYSLC